MNFFLKIGDGNEFENVERNSRESRCERLAVCLGKRDFLCKPEKTM